MTSICMSCMTLTEKEPQRIHLYIQLQATIGDANRKSYSSKWSSIAQKKVEEIFGKQKAGREMLAPRILGSKVKQYELLASPTQAKVGLNVVQLHCEDREIAAVKNTTIKNATVAYVTVVAEKQFISWSGQTYKAPIEGNNGDSSHERHNPKRLELVEVFVYGTTAQALVYSGTNLNVIVCETGNGRGNPFSTVPQQ